MELKTAVREMNIPGIRRNMPREMKQRIAQHRNEASKHCIKPEDVKKPKEDSSAPTSLPIRRIPHGRRQDRHCDGMQQEDTTGP